MVAITVEDFLKPLSPHGEPTDSTPYQELGYDDAKVTEWLQDKSPRVLHGFIYYLGWSNETLFNAIDYVISREDADLATIQTIWFACGAERHVSRLQENPYESQYPHNISKRHSWLDQIKVNYGDGFYREIIQASPSELTVDPEEALEMFCVGPKHRWSMPPSFFRARTTIGTLRAMLRL